MAGQTSLLVVAIAGITIYGFTRAFGDANMMPILCLVADPRYRATGYGLLNLFACLAGGLAIYAGGSLMDHGVSLSIVFQLSAGILVVFTLCLLAVKPRQRQDASEA